MTESSPSRKVSICSYFREDETSQNVDLVIEKIGFGRWQIFSVILSPLFSLVMGSQSISGTILNANIDFKCLSTSANYSLDAYNHLNASRINDPLIFASSSYSDLDICTSPGCNSEISDTLIEQINPELPLNCQNIIYDNSTFSSTFTTEFNLVGDRRFYRTFFDTALFLGTVFGCVTAGILCDRYGRRQIIRIGVLGNSVTTVSMIFAQNIWLILFLRFLYGFVLLIVCLPSYCLGMEITPARLRPTVGLLSGIGYSGSIVILSIEGYFWFRDWRDLFFVSTLPSLIIMPLILVLEESPRWLAQKGRIDEATEILIKASKLNKSNLSEELIKSTFQECTDSSFGSKSTWDLLKEMRSSLMMVKIIITTSLIKLITNILYYGILFNASHVATNIYLYIATIGGVGVCLMTASVPICSFFKRRYVMSACFLITSICMITDLIVPTSFFWLRIVTVMMSYGAMAVLFEEGYIVIPELFPTDVRGVGFSIFNFSGYFGSIFAPIIPEVMGSLWWGVPSLFGTISLIGSIIVWILPETIEQPLFNSIQEFEKYVENNNEDRVETYNNFKENKIEIPV